MYVHRRLSAILAWFLLCTVVVVLLTHNTATVLVSQKEDLDDAHALLLDEEKHEGVPTDKHWNAAHNDEIRSENIGRDHPSSAWHHELFSLPKPVKTIPKQARVIRSMSDAANQVQFYPLRWLQQQDEPAAITRAPTGLARKQQLWDASANDKVLEIQNPKWSSKAVNAQIGEWQAGADDQSDKASLPGVFKSARTQKLFIVPQANVLTGQGQKQTSTGGAETVRAAKGLGSFVAEARKRNTLAKKKASTKASLTKNARIPGDPSKAEFGQSGMTLAEFRALSKTSSDDEPSSSEPSGGVPSFFNRITDSPLHHRDARQQALSITRAQAREEAARIRQRAEEQAREEREKEEAKMARDETQAAHEQELWNASKDGGPESALVKIGQEADK